MNARKLILLMGVFCLFSAKALADRPLERGEILQIFEQLTSQPKKTWISAGTIQASHLEYRSPKTTDPKEINAAIRATVQSYQDSSNESKLVESLRKMEVDAIPFNVRYKLSNESTMNSVVLIKFDGERFLWEININDRTDTVIPDKDTEDNFMARRFYSDWNQRRIFVWDGESYTTYFLPGNHAIVERRNPGLMLTKINGDKSVQPGKEKHQDQDPHTPPEHAPSAIACQPPYSHAWVTNCDCYGS